MMQATAPIKQLLIVGAGRVAFHLAKALQSHANSITTAVFSRKIPVDLPDWPENVNCYHSWETLPDVDLVVVAVSDASIAEVAKKGSTIPAVNNALWVHTSGATSIEVLRDFLPRYGLFYPLQSFSKNVAVQWPQIPVGIDTASAEDLKILEFFAQMLGAKTFKMDELQRRHLHLAAVFANNFTNHCLGIAAEILQHSGLDFELLKPLIELTFQKALTQPPFEVQTGPAVRGDQNTLTQHETILSAEFSQYLEVYQALTRQIILTHTAPS